MAKQITQDVFWIGVNDEKSMEFHGIATPKGGSYNSYLILDSEPTIIDSTNTKYLKRYIESLSENIDPKDIKHIVINHAEPDHAGAIKEILKLCPDADIYCTKKCAEFLKEAFGVEKTHVVKEGDELSTGKYNLFFHPHPMIHWPETMFTYLKEKKTLFSGDLFGTDISHSHMFADEMEPFEDITRDYFTIVMRPFASQVKSAVDKVRNMDIDLLAPSHGPIYRKDINSIIDYYERLSTNPEEDKVFILYSSIWHSTQKMANEISIGALSQVKKVVMMDLHDSNLITIMGEALTSKVIAFGSLTMNASYHPMFETVLKLIKLNNQKKKAVVFGTHGWVPASVPKLKIELENLGYEILDEIDIRFGPKTDKDIKQLREMGKKIALL